MLKHAVITCLALLSRSAFADSDLIALRLADLSKAAECGNAKSSLRPWCIAADGWAKGTPSALPAKNSLVGFTIELRNQQNVRSALGTNVTLSQIAFAQTGKPHRAKITNIVPENPKEAEMAFTAILSLTDVFKGKAETAKLPKELGDFLASAKATYDMKRTKSEWTWQGASKAALRKVGAYWVAIETENAENGIWVGVYTDKFD